jgi:uncharacterized protein
MTAFYVSKANIHPNEGIIKAMNKKHEIQTALTAAMKSRDEDTKKTLRLVMSAIKLIEVETGTKVDDSRVLNLLQKEVKTREDIIAESKTANRQDLVANAEKEIEILNKFLPEQMTHDELTTIAQSVIEQTGASNIQEMGKVMKQLIPLLEGRASGQEASKIVRDLLEKA